MERKIREEKRRKYLGEVTRQKKVALGIKHYS